VPARALALAIAMLLLIGGMTISRAQPVSESADAISLIAAADPADLDDSLVAPAAPALTAAPEPRVARAPAPISLTGRPHTLAIFRPPR